MLSTSIIFISLCALWQSVEVGAYTPQPPIVTAFEMQEEINFNNSQMVSSSASGQSIRFIENGILYDYNPTSSSWISTQLLENISISRILKLEMVDHHTVVGYYVRRELLSHLSEPLGCSDQGKSLEIL